MKNILVLISLMLALSIVVVPEIKADTLTVYQGAYSSGIGGEFNIVSATLGNFPTFCLEFNEHFTPGNTYDYAVSSKAIYGGVGPQGDPISVGTAWLYSLFRAGTLPGYDYSGNPGRIASAGALQNTIWWLEGEAGDPGAGNTFRQAVINQFGSNVLAQADAAPGAYGVYALNLTVPGTGALAQDMLTVPEPGILILLGLAMSAIGIAVPFVRKI